MTPKTTAGTWGKGNLLCPFCGNAMETEWVQKPGQPHVTARHKACSCEGNAAYREIMGVWQKIRDKTTGKKS